MFLYGLLGKVRTHRVCSPVRRRRQGHTSVLLPGLQEASTHGHQLHRGRGPEDLSGSRVLDPAWCGATLRRHVIYVVSRGKGYMLLLANVFL